MTTRNTKTPLKQSHERLWTRNKTEHNKSLLLKDRMLNDLVNSSSIVSFGCRTWKKMTLKTMISLVKNDVANWLRFWYSSDPLFKLDTLSQRQLTWIVDSTSLTLHVLFPGIRARFSSTPSFFFASKCSTNFSTYKSRRVGFHTVCRDIYVDNSTVRSRRTRNE